MKEPVLTDEGAEIAGRIFYEMFKEAEEGRPENESLRNGNGEPDSAGAGAAA